MDNGRTWAAGGTVPSLRSHRRMHHASHRTMQPANKRPVITAMSQAQVPQVKVFLRAMWAEHFGTEPDPFVREYFNDPATLSDLDDLDAHYFGARGTALVALDGQQLVGTGELARLDDGTAELRRLFLLPGYRGMGIGSAITVHLLAFARHHGYRIIRLGSHRKLHASHRLYERFGFKPIPAYDGNTSDLVLYFQLDLDQPKAQPADPW